ncbi:SDR family NAD(P)-dependent oxidoreductase [Xylophilus sp. GW821-FHT01B05]
MTLPHLYILTGASRGMGRAMAEQLLQPGQHVIGISRSTDAALASHALRYKVVLEQWEHDLQDAGPAVQQLQDRLAGSSAPWSGATLINNAGVIPAVVPLHDAGDEETARALRVGLEAAMRLTAAFLGATRNWKLPRRVLNISSGLGRRPMASQAAYCAAKAGMDMFTRCTALDEARLPHGARLCALAPGVIDTDMQQHLRSANASAFPDRARFEALRAEHRLLSPPEAATRVLAYLARADFGDEAVADVRD